MQFRDTGKYVNELADALCAILDVPDDTDGMQLREFRFGTLSGLYRTNDDVFDIVAVSNSNPGNGHFRKLMRHLKRRCRESGKLLRFVEMQNPRLTRHLVEKHGFVESGVNCEWECR